MYHVGKTRHAAESQAFYDSVSDIGNINRDSEAFQVLSEAIGNAYFDGNMDITTTMKIFLKSLSVMSVGT